MCTKNDPPWLLVNVGVSRAYGIGHPQWAHMLASPKQEGEKTSKEERKYTNFKKKKKRVNTNTVYSLVAEQTPS